MTLSFSTKWPTRMGELAGQPNYFMEKIWQGLPVVDGFDYRWQDFRHTELFGKPWDKPDRTIPKLHTIRQDPHDRWRPGMGIHMVINNRTKNRFQFAPVIKCVSVQEIYIFPFKNGLGRVIIDGYNYYDWMPFKNKGLEQLDQLAKNDGFPSVESFFQYFNTDFKGKIIHWTDLKY